MANQQTSPAAPPSIALARMAMRRAGFGERAMFPVPRSEAHCSICTPKSVEYYRIIDRISAGEQP